MTGGYYECDRCGEFEKGPIRRRKTHNNSADFSDKQYRKISFGHRTGEGNGGSVSKHIDLCEECRKDLTEWINDGPKNRQIEAS